MRSVIVRDRRSLKVRMQELEKRGAIIEEVDADSFRAWIEGNKNAQFVKVAKKAPAKTEPEDGPR